MTANPNPGASGAIACPTCHSAIGEPCVSQQLQPKRPVPPKQPPTLHPHPARVAGYAPIARAAREAELAAYRASEEAALARRVSEHEREQAVTAAALEWLDQAAAVTPPPDPEILDLIRGGLRHTQETEDYLHRAWVERWERDQPRVPVPPATTPETAPPELASTCVHDIAHWPVPHQQAGTCRACGLPIRLHRAAPTAWYGFSLGAVRETRNGAVTYARRHGLTDRAAYEQLAADCGFAHGAFVTKTGGQL